MKTSDQFLLCNSTPQSSMTYSPVGAWLPGSARGLPSVQPGQSVAHHTEGHRSPASPRSQRHAAPSHGDRPVSETALGSHCIWHRRVPESSPSIKGSQALCALPPSVPGFPPWRALGGSDGPDCIEISTPAALPAAGVLPPAPVPGPAHFPTLPWNGRACLGR